MMHIGLGRILMSILVGAFGGASIVTIGNLILGWSTNGLTAGNFGSLGLLIFIVAFMTWLLGLIAFGLAPWWLLHRAGLTGWYIAGALGFVMTFIVTLAMATRVFGLMPQPAYEHSEYWSYGHLLERDGTATTLGWWVRAGVCSVYGGVGFLVGLTVRSIAYARPNQPDRSD